MSTSPSASTRSGGIAAAAPVPTKRRGSVIATPKKNMTGVPMAVDVTRRSSVCIPSSAVPSLPVRPKHLSPHRDPLHRDKSGGGSRINFGNIFGSSSRRSGGSSSSGQVSAAVGSGGVQGKIAKRNFDRQQSNQGQSVIKVEDYDSDSHKRDKKGKKDSSNYDYYNHNDSKRAQFVQSRSSTGLSLFGVGRRRSIAITDDAYNAAMRGAKSHVDISHLCSVQSPILGRKGAAAGPGLSELREAEERGGGGGGCTTPKARDKLKMSFNNRPWAELERLWRGKSKESPSIESLFKPRSSFRSKDRQARSKTIPLGGGEGGVMDPRRWPPSSPASVAKSASPNSPSLSPAGKLALSPAASSTGLSPSMTRKAIDLLAPEVLSPWLSSRGYPSPSPAGFHRSPSVPAAAAAAAAAAAGQGAVLGTPLGMRREHSSGANLAAVGPSHSQDSDHFEELVRVW